MIKLKTSNHKYLEINQIISDSTIRETSIELSLPKSLDFGSEISSSDFFEKNFSQSKSLYKSKSLSLTLLYTKYLGKKDLTTDQLNTSLSLFSHQYIQRLKDHIYVLSKEKPELLPEKVTELLNEIQKIIKSFRELELNDEKAIVTFEKVDFLLSFETEQFFLRLVSFLQKVKYSNESRIFIISLAELENSYRKKKNYHSDDGDFHLVKDNDDKFIRILNRIEMRKRLMELPLKVSEKIVHSGKKEKYISLAISTGIIMSIVGFILLQARLMGMDSTFQFVIGLALLYVMRDLFKEEFKEIIYNKIISKRPKIKGEIFIANNESIVGRTKVWFSKEDNNQFQQKNYKDKISLLFNERISLNRFEHHGFTKLKTSTNINISSIMNMIERDDRKLLIYGDSNDTAKIFKLPRQYQLNLTIKEKTLKKKNYFEEESDCVEKVKNFLIIINRDKIIDIKEKNID